MARTLLDGMTYARMIEAGAANLSLHVKEVNDLNVFPIPDGDTGENMMLTVRGGATAVKAEKGNNLSETADTVARGMLLGARGNSGVILSQLFAGIADGFHTHTEADLNMLEKAFVCGVGCAYEAVVTPTPGTILTVIHDACSYAGNQNCTSVEEYFAALIAEAHRSLARTPELLPVLKDAGVVDSGGMGLVYILEGMYASLCGKRVEEIADTVDAISVGAVDPSLFSENDILEFGYCTELLLRLQTAKTDPAAFDLNLITDYLNTVGNSVVTVKNGSIVKLHVHTMEPYRVLEFCQRFGEFLTVKIENMMLQHNGIKEDRQSVPASAEAEPPARRPFGVVAVAMGEGICSSFRQMGADEVILGGQTMNPSAEDFLHAFERIHADTVFVLPNNSNVLLAARQAASICRTSDVRVIPTKTVGDGYAVLSMLDLSGDADSIEESMNEAMEDVATVEISRAIRDASMNGIEIHKDDYIGIMGKTVLAAGCDREAVAGRCIDALQPERHELLLVIRGRQTDVTSADALHEYIRTHYPRIELCAADGGQDIYDYILVAE